MTDPDRIREILDEAQPADIPELLRAVNLFAHSGTMSPEDAEAWRDAILLRFLEISAEDVQA